MNIIKKLMAKLAMRKFVPTPQEVKEEKAVPMDKIEIIEALKNYKVQNPIKYEAKKEALFKKYGLTIEEEPMLETVPDAADLELEALKASEVKKSKAK